MRRLALSVLLACLAGLLAPAHASAATASVSGTNAYKRLTVNNADARVVLTLKAPGGACDIKYLRVNLRDKDGTRYSVDAGCYPGATWASSLVRGSRLVSCSGLRLGYDEDRGQWRAIVPRTCLTGLANRIKSTSSYVDDYSPAPGEAGPTPWIARG
jgi:hypothetical protein